MKEKILFAVKVGQPDWAEIVLTTKPEQFEAATNWAKANGFDRFRISVIDLTIKPNFIKTIN